MIKKVLFLCKGNAARSQMAEAIINNYYRDKFVARSAGTDPEDKINPYAVRAMTQMNIDISDKIPKPLSVFSNEGFDFVITLCNKGNENCIQHIGKPILSHWDIPDPAEFEGTDHEIMSKVNEILKLLITRVRLLANLPMDKLDKLASESNSRELYPH